MMSHDSVAKALPVPWFFCLKRWDTHCGEIDEINIATQRGKTNEINRLPKTKAIQSLFEEWHEPEILRRYVLRSVALHRLPARQSKWTKRSNEMALTTWAEDEINGRTRIAWIQSWSWCACQPWRSVSNEGSVSHENMCRNWEGTWNMVRNLDAELTLEKKFRFFLPVHIAGFPPFKKFRVYPFIREGNKHRGVEVRQSRWSHHGNLHPRHANSTAERWRVQVDPVLHGGSGLAFGVHGGLVMHNEWRRNAP